MIAAYEQAAAIAAQTDAEALAAIAAETDADEAAAAALAADKAAADSLAAAANKGEPDDAVTAAVNDLLGVLSSAFDVLTDTTPEGSTEVTSTE
ncbi:MAG: hypothetical protein RPU72_04065 [Candidatus Sedimenticola sp. (ex Thyasira tokunagai)]